MHTSLAQIESAARALSFARSVLSTHVAELQEEIAAAQKRHLLKIKKSVALCAGLDGDLRAMVTESKPLFDKPKTHIFHGICVGYRKQKGSIEIPDKDRTVQLIERLYQDNPDLLALLVITEKTPSKKAIADLPVADAKKIGCQIIGDTDAIVVKPVDDAVEKIVTALLASAIEEQE